MRFSYCSFLKVRCSDLPDVQGGFQIKGGSQIILLFIFR